MEEEEGETKGSRELVSKNLRSFLSCAGEGEEEIGRGKFSSLGKEETTALGNTLDRPVERRK